MKGFEYIIISDDDKEQIRTNLIPAMKQTQSKPIMKQYQVCVKAIARRDYPTNWKSVEDEIKAMLTTKLPDQIYVGLQVLKNVIRKYEYELDSGRELFNQLIDNVYGLVEALIPEMWDHDSPEALSLMT